MGIVLNVLGSMTVEADGEQVTLRPAQRRLLAILAVERGRTVPVEQLIDRFWAGEPPATARAALQTHIAAIRRVLGVEAVATEAWGYQLGVQIRTDVEEFEHLAQRFRQVVQRDPTQAVLVADAALEFVRGDVWSELAADDFAAPERARVEELVYEIVEARVSAMFAEGRHLECIADLEQLVAAHPYREQLWRLLIIGRHRGGRHAEAVRAFRDLESRLAEIGLEPTALTQRLEGLVLRHDPALDPTWQGAPTRNTTRLIGRDEDLQRVLQLLGERRLVTLVGPGGCGKTRLANEVAISSDRDTAFVDLTTSTDRRVGSTVAAVLGMPGGDDTGDPGLTERIVAVLNTRPRLLVLDNCEHVIDECAAMVDALVAGSSTVQVLATSREALGIVAEQVHRVEPLGTGGRRSAPSDAAALFLDRARGARSDFVAEPGDLDDIEEICRRVDGLPLAIEFAAARVTHLPVQAILRRLHGQLRLLAGGRRMIERHRTLEATFEWSHGLLDDTERVLLRRLSVFAGSFALERVEDVCADDRLAVADVVTTIGSLVDKSLVVEESLLGQPRYRLLETVRSFARRALEDAGELDELMDRHCLGYRGWLESQPWGSSLFDHHVATAQIAALHNVRVALRHARARGWVDVVAALVSRTHVLWSPSVGLGAEGAMWVEAVGDLDALDVEARAAVLITSSLAQATLGTARQEVDADRAIDLGVDLGGYICEAHGLRTLAPAMRGLRDGPALRRQAEECQEEMGSVAASVGGPGWQVYAEAYRAMVAVVYGDLEAAAQAHDRAMAARELFWIHRAVLAAEVVTCRCVLGRPMAALEAARRLDGPFPAGVRPRPMLSAALALTHAALGDDSQARSYLRGAIEIAGERQVFLEPNACLTYASAVAVELGDPALAVRLRAASQVVGGAADAAYRFRSPVVYALHRHVGTLVHDRLDGDTIAAERAAGRSLSDADALALVRRLAEVGSRGSN